MDRHIISDADANLVNGHFSMEALAALVREMGVPAFVEHSGGGCATMYVGTRREDEDGEERYDLLVGPGTYSEPSFGTFADFVIGPDDDGMGDVFDPHAEGLTTLRQMAAYIAARMRSV